jgi:hypothetical protein
MAWHRVIIIILFITSLVGCRDKTVVNCNKILIEGFGIFLDEPYPIPYKSSIQVMYPDSSFTFEGTYINLNVGEPYINLGFDYYSNKNKFSSNAIYTIVLDDTLHFHIEDIKIKTDTAGMNGMGNWVIGCIIDSFTVNGTRVKSISTNDIYPPVSLIKSYKDK